jgi:hypothetical protein
VLGEIKRDFLVTANVGYHPSMSKVSLGQLANLRFSDLSETESSVLHAVENGQEAAATSPSSIRAEILEWLCTDTDAIEKVHRHGLALRGYGITGLLDLIHGDIRFPIQMHECAFDTDIWLKSVRLRSLSFRACSLQGMNADSAIIDTNLLLINGCETHGEISLRGAVVGGDIRTDGSTFNGSDNFALVCDRVRVSGGVFLSRTSSIGRYYGEVRFAGADVSGNFDCEHAIFDNKGGTSINLERLKTSGSLFLRESVSSGIVNVSASKIEIALDCREAKILSGADRAFHAEKITVGTHALLDGGFSCGNAHFLGATVGGGLRCRASSIRKLDLRYARISGHFEWVDMDKPKESLIDLRDATVDSIKDDVQSWPGQGKLMLDGLRFERFSDSVTDVESRLRWLQLDATEPVQAYRQLSRVYLSNGHTEDATKLLFALEKLIRSRETSIPRRLWNGLLMLTIGFGYQLWRAAVLMILLIVIGTGVSVIAYRTKLVAPTDKDANALFVSNYRVPAQYPRFSSTIFSIEHSLPGLNLGVSGSWSSNTTAEWPQHRSVGPAIRLWFWLQTMLGWLLSIFFLAGISGIVKSSK